MRLSAALGLLAGIFALVCPGCDRGDAGGPPKIRLQLNWVPEPQFGGFYAGQLAGAYEKHGVAVEIVPGGVGTPTVSMIGAGSVEFAVVSADQLLLARREGNDVVALFAVYQTNPQGIMTHASRGFNEIADVFKAEGTLAMQSGLPYADYLQRKYGFGGLHIVPSPGGGVTQFLTDKNFSQQCFVTSEPITARREGADPKTFLIADAGYNPYTTVLVTRGEYLRKNPAAVRAMVRAVREGWRAYLDDPQPANALMNGLNPTMDAAAFAESAAAQKPLIETDETKRLGLGAMTAERWRTLAQQLVELKVLETVPPPEECFVDAEKLPAGR